MSFQLEIFHEWLVDNRSSLHLGKTESILFGTRDKLRDASISITCNGTAITSVSAVKYMGIKLDSLFSGELHIIIKGDLTKVAARLSFLYQNSPKVLSHCVILSFNRILTIVVQPGTQV